MPMTAAEDDQHEQQHQPDHTYSANPPIAFLLSVRERRMSSGAPTDGLAHTLQDTLVRDRDLDTARRTAAYDPAPRRQPAPAASRG